MSLRAPDLRLPDIAAAIADRLGFDPPDIKSKLTPPRLRVLKDGSQNSYTVQAGRETRLAAVKERFASALPIEFQTFRRQTPIERAERG